MLSYYTPESVGIATGMLITALHYAGLATLTRTPSPMGFLRTVLEHPAHDLLLVAGFPAEAATVPTLSKRSFGEVATFRQGPWSITEPALSVIVAPFGCA